MEKQRGNLATGENPSADLPDRHPLYAELLAIGSKSKTMRAAALMDYEHLLTCPEVSRRAGPLAGLDERALHAEAALRGTIATIVVPLTRLVAEAALCAKTIYEGETVSTRVAAIDGMTLNIFKYRRELAFDYIVEVLTRPTGGISQASSGSKSYQTPPEPGIYLQEFEKLADRAAILHYAALAAMFAWDLDDRLRSEGRWLNHGLEMLLPRTTLLEYLFDRYVQLIHVTSTFYLGELLYSRRGLSADHIAERFPDRIPLAIAIELCMLLESIDHNGPIPLIRLNKRQRRALTLNFYPKFQQAERHSIYARMWAANLSRSPAGTRTSRGPHSREHFFEFSSHIVAATGLIIRSVTEHLKLRTPVHVHGRRLAHKALSNSYDFDEWEPTIDGISLRYAVDVFFDTESPNLTNRVFE